jgi:hypothetical protein
MAVAALTLACSPAASSDMPPSLTVRTTVSAVAVSTPTSVVAAEFTCTLTSSIQGTGNFSRSIDWDIDMGPGTLSDVTDGSVTYHAPPSVTDEAAVAVRATSVEDGTKSAAVTLSLVSTAECASPEEASGCLAKYGPPADDLCVYCNSGNLACPHWTCACGMCAVELCPDGQRFGAAP